jgi:hypothetical protein
MTETAVSTSSEDRKLDPATVKARLMLSNPAGSRETGSAVSASTRNAVQGRVSISGPGGRKAGPRERVV